MRQQPQQETLISLASCNNNNYAEITPLCHLLGARQTDFEEIPVTKAMTSYPRTMKELEAAWDNLVVTGSGSSQSCFAADLLHQVTESGQKKALVICRYRKHSCTAGETQARALPLHLCCAPSTRDLLSHVGRSSPRESSCYFHSFKTFCASY